MASVTSPDRLTTNPVGSASEHQEPAGERRFSNGPASAIAPIGRGFLTLRSAGRPAELELSSKEAATVAVARRRGDLLAGGLPSRLRHLTRFRCRICDTAVASCPRRSAQAFSGPRGRFRSRLPEPIIKRQSARGAGYHGTAMEVPGTPAGVA